MNEMIAREAKREELRALSTTGMESISHRRKAAELWAKVPAWIRSQMETRKSLRNAAKKEAQRLEIKAQTVKPAEAAQYKDKAKAIRNRYERLR